MKRTLFTFVTLLSVSSCGGNKAQIAETANEEPPLLVETELPVPEPEPVESELTTGRDMSGTWMQQSAENGLVSDGEFRFCRDGLVMHKEDDAIEIYDRYYVTVESKVPKLNLFREAGENRSWMIRILEDETFEVAAIEPCPPNKSCYPNVLKESTPVSRYGRVSVEAICTE